MMFNAVSSQRSEQREAGTSPTLCNEWEIERQHKSFLCLHESCEFYVVHYIDPPHQF